MMRVWKWGPWSKPCKDCECTKARRSESIQKDRDHTVSSCLGCCYPVLGLPNFDPHTYHHNATTCLIDTLDPLWLGYVLFPIKNHQRSLLPFTITSHWKSSRIIKHHLNSSNIIKSHWKSSRLIKTHWKSSSQEKTKNLRTTKIMFHVFPKQNRHFLLVPRCACLWSPSIFEHSWETERAKGE